MAKYGPAPTTAAGIVRLIRAKSGLTQSELAAAAGVAQQTISAYETARMDPTFETLERLAEAARLQITVRLEAVSDHDEGVEAFLEAMDPTDRAAHQRQQAERLKEASMRRAKGK